jgi:uncharacterized membrane protein YoaK (UPF0700 family)
MSDYRPRIRAAGAVIRQVFKAVLIFVGLAIAVPLVLGALSGVPSASIVSLVISTLILQAAAPPLGLALGLTPAVILAIMACFSIGIILAILEICDSMSMSSERVRGWIDSIGKKMEKYPVIKKYGAISCIIIAWIPGIGLYGTPIIAWILGWKRLPVLVFTTVGFTIAAVFVLFFASRLSIEQILMLVAIVVICVIAVVGIRKYTRKKKK